VLEPVPIDHQDPTMAAEIVRVQRAAYRVEADLIDFDGIPNLHETVDDIRSLGLTVLGIVEDGRLVALLGYDRDGDTVDIDRLAVAPTHHRRGLASMLLQALHRRESSARRFEVSTGAANAPAVALYESLGYEPVATVTIPMGLETVRLAWA
jgi:ribosomal protein S18 acetylase RimI-like enzyme